MTNVVAIRGARKSPFIGWLTSSYSVHGSVALIFLLNNFLTGFLFPSDTGVIPGQLPVHLYDLLTGVSGALTLFVIGLYARGRQITSVTQSFIAWLVSAISALVVPLMVEYFIIGSEFFEERVKGFLFGLESYMAQFATFTLIVAAVVSMRSASFELARNRHALHEIQLNLSTEVLELRAEIERQVAEQIEPVLAELRASIAGSSDFESTDVRNAIPNIKSAIDHVVRPLSHTLGMSTQVDAQIPEIGTPSVAELRKEISRVSLRSRWFIRMPLAVTIQPVLGLLNLSLFVLPTIIYLFDFRSLVVAGLPALALIASAQLAVRRIVFGIRIPYLFANVVGITINFALGALFCIPAFALSVPIESKIIQSFAIGSGFILAVTGYFGLVVERRMLFLDQARGANNDIASALSRMRHELLVSKRQLGRLLHGGVQARLQSAMLRLSRAQVISKAVVDEVVADLDDAQSLLTRIDVEVPEDLGAQLDSVIDFWDGICDVEVSITRELDETISKDPVAVQCVIEVVREAVANAVKHGKSKSARVNVSVSRPGKVVVKVNHDEVDDRALTLQGNGLGSHIYDELTDGWVLKKTGNLATFEATIPAKI